MGHELGIPTISSNTVEFYKEKPSGLSMKIFTHIWSISIPEGLLGLLEVAFAELQRAEETHWSPLHLLLGSLGPVEPPVEPPVETPNPSGSLQKGDMDSQGQPPGNLACHDKWPVHIYKM